MRLNLDMGHVVSGFVTFEIQAPAGVILELAYLEEPLTDPTSNIDVRAGTRYIARGEHDRDAGGGPGEGLVVGGEGLDGDGEQEHLERDEDDDVHGHRRGGAGVALGGPHGWYPRAQMVSSRISTSMRPRGRGGGPEMTVPVRVSKLPS